MREKREMKRAKKEARRNAGEAPLAGAADPEAGFE